MSIATNVLSLLNIARSISSDVRSVLALVRGDSGTLDAIDTKLDLLLAQTSGPETATFFPPRMEPNMSVLQMAVGDAPHSSVMTFSESGPAPSDGAVTGDNDAVAMMTLDPSDHASWTITLVPGAGPASPTDPPVVITFSYTGTSVPPDAGPVMVEPLVLTVVPVPVAETGQFNP